MGKKKEKILSQNVEEILQIVFHLRSFVYRIIKWNPKSDWCKNIRQRVIKFEYARPSLEPSYFEPLDDI